MPPTLLPEAAPMTVEHPKATRSTLHPVWTALASSLLLWLAFPPVERAPLAWLALAPLFSLVRSDRPGWQVYLAGWAGGLGFWLLAVEWVRLTDPSAWLGWLVLAGALSLWWPAFLMLARPMVRSLKLPLMIAAPLAWVALEYVRAHGPLNGLPWYFLAHTQYKFIPVIQISDLTGAYGLSFLIAMCSAWLVELVQLPLMRPTARGPRLRPMQAVRLSSMVLAFIATLGYGFARLSTADFRPGPRLALLQSNLPTQMKMSLTATDILINFRALCERALPERPDLLVWPETSYPRGIPYIDAGLGEPEFLSQVRDIDKNFVTADWRDRDALVRAELNAWADYWKTPMLVGAVAHTFRPGGYAKYNSAVLISPGITANGRYDKLHLVPFGEYVPLLKTLPWVTRLTPYNGSTIPSLSFGARPVGFTAGKYRYATAICFEDTIPHVVRGFFGDANTRPDVLLNISNDGWFGGSSELDMHLAISVFRCVENRVPLARAVNTGISALVDGNGRIVTALSKMKEGVLVVVAPLDGRASLYSRHGDWMARTCLAATIGLLVIHGARRGRKPR